MNFNFILKKSQPFGIIMLQLTDKNHKTYYIQTPLRIFNEMWDEQKQRPKNIYLKSSKKINVKLDRLRIGITDYLTEIKEKKKKISLYTLNKLIKKYCSLDNFPYSEGSLLYNMYNYIHSREHLITKSTYKRYMVFFRLLERFEGNTMKNLMIDDVNSTFVKQFLLFGHSEEYSQSTLFRTIYFVKTILIFLEKRGIRTYAYELELPKEKINKKNIITLKESELISIKQIEIPIQLKAARDWLIISCYTGQRISDFMNFNINMTEVIGEKKCISFIQQKTQQNIYLPLHPEVSNILLDNENVFPKKLTTQKYNEQIKEVVKLAGINELVTVEKRLGHRSKTTLIPKWKAITSHIGRRSFASNFYGKIPTPLLMQATGHSTEQMFKRYISFIDTERIRSLGAYFEQIYNENQLGIS